MSLCNIWVTNGQSPKNFHCVFSGPSGEASGTGAASPDMSDLRYRHKKFQKMATASPPLPTAAAGMAAPTAAGASDAPVNGSGRYVCPYCQMACAKPSVLQKHVRAHTNERPYPCRYSHPAAPTNTPSPGPLTPRSVCWCLFGTKRCPCASNGAGLALSPFHFLFN